MAASRSLSLCRSSSAPRTSVTPSAKSPSTAISGTSSISSGTSSGATAVPRRSPGVTRIVPHGSPRVVPSSRVSIRAPMRRTTSRNPSRVGFRPHPRTTSSRPETSAAATKNAADDTSPGTAISNDGIRRPARPAAPRRGRVRRGRGPSRACARCGRANRCGRRCATAPRPAARRAPRRPSPGRSPRGGPRPGGGGCPVPGRKHSGSRVPPARASMRAPIARSGVTTRAMGRAESEASPTRVANRGRPASMPDSRRVVVPELPASSTARGLGEAAEADPADRQRPVRRFRHRHPEPLEAAAGGAGSRRWRGVGARRSCRRPRRRRGATGG